MKPILKVVCPAVFFGALLYFVYGLVQFPDSPIGQCGDNAYCGKQGQPRTVADFNAFKQWQSTMPWAMALGIAATFVWQRFGKKNSKTEFGTTDPDD